MRITLLAAGTAGLIGLFTACGGDDRPNVVDDAPAPSAGKGGGKGTHPRPNNGGASEGGASNEGGASELGETNDPLAPVIAIISPEAVNDPNDDGVLTATAVTVKCQVQQSLASGAGKLNPATIKLFALADGSKILDEKAGLPTANANEFANEFELVEVPAGRVGFGCSASDDEQHTATAKVFTFLDKGPSITFETPIAATAYPLSGLLDVKFSVEPAPLADGDDGAAVTAVTLEMGGQKIDLAGAEDHGSYHLSVNLTDAALFNPAPNGPFPLTVSATNSRRPQAVQAVKEQQISIDGEGPTITLSKPVSGDVVGGKVQLTFKAVDPIAGVDTVIVSLNMDENKYERGNDKWTRSGDNFTFEFDSRTVTNSAVQITVNITAKDLVGNVSTGASALLYLDNYPPTVDLDPENIRTTAVRGKPTAETKCSTSFDPVGNAAKNDLGKAELAGIFRAVVFDNTNSAKEIPILHFSKVNPASVRLYLQTDPTQPLLKDKDEDPNHICDEVAEVDSNDSLALVSVSPSNTPKNGHDDDADPKSGTLGCTTDNPNQPDALCSKVSDMWQVIEDEYNKVPVIYAADVKSGLECTGVAWEFGSKVRKNGWVCLAVRAVDNAGNVGVSRPLRLCVNSPDRPVPACANSSVDTPTCTDGCTPPPRWGSVLYYDP